MRSNLTEVYSDMNFLMKVTLSFLVLTIQQNYVEQGEIFYTSMKQTILRLNLTTNLL